MSEKNKKAELKDEELEKINGGSDENTNACPYNFTKINSSFCKFCSHATLSEAGFVISCDLGIQKDNGIVSSVTPV